MNSKRRWIAALAATVVCFLGGCVSQRIIWSPDGKQAAVLADKGLHVCDAEGRLSGLLVPDTRIAAWFPDSVRLAVVVQERFQTWADLKQRMPQQTRIESLAKGFLARAKESGLGWTETANAFR